MGIEVRDLVKKWDAVRAVDNVSFNVPQGTFTVLLGPSGCGKSTILRMIAGLEDATAGRIFISGEDVTGYDPAKRGVSMVFQSYALFPHLTVRENILFGLKVRGVPKAEQLERLRMAAEMVGLQDLLERKPAQLSGGQRQRVALSRTIVSNQPVCLMDEPLSNLDAKLRGEMREEISSLQRKLALTMIYVTHDQTEAMSMADQVVLLNSGQIEQVGTPAELYEYPASVFAARFLGVPPMNVLRVESIDIAQATVGATPRYESNWQFGIRPEHIQLGREGIPVVVKSIDYMGAESVLRLNLGSQDMHARVNGRSTLEIGDTLHASWRTEDIHFFDEKGLRQSEMKNNPELVS